MFNGQQVGPMTKENLEAYGITADSKVWREGMAEWQPVYMIPELMEIANKSVPPHMDQPVVDRTKDKTVAGILAILLGGLGVQYFYLGKVGAGLVTILLTIVTCGIWEILTLVQGIMMLVMTQEEFNSKYVYTSKFLPLF